MTAQQATIFAACIGFLGVCFTLYWNARSTRKVRQHERDADRRALVESLLGELETNKLLLDPYHEAFELWSNGRNVSVRLKNLKVGSWVVTDLFDVSVEKLGLLNSITIRKITYCYSNLKMFDYFVRQSVTRLATASSDGHMARPDIVITVSPESAFRVQSHIQECIEAILDSIAALEDEQRSAK